MLTEAEVPVAYAMTKVVTNLQPDHRHPFHDFLCLWTAFNNIYRTLAAARGHLPRPKVTPSNVLSRKQNGSVQVPQVQHMPAESTDIELAIGLLSDETIDALLRMPETRFFAERVPSWHNRSISYDSLHQRLNGVISVGKTTSAEDPVWSPIDTPAYERFMSRTASVEDKKLLAEQIVFLLYTVRNNLFHGGKAPGQENDEEVVKEAIPLLKEVVVSFLAFAG